jgi:acyl-CoA thioester hydrolase
MNYYRFDICITNNDIDQYQHVNNEVYLRWLMQAASAHSQDAGYGVDHFIKSKKGFVVRRHEIDYLLSAVLGDTLFIKTWVQPDKGARSIRHYLIVREEDEKIIVKAQTLWVYIDLERSRPIEIPVDMMDHYKALQKHH